MNHPTKYPEAISLTGEYTPRVDTIGLLHKARENEKNLLLKEGIGTPMNAQEVNQFNQEFLAMSRRDADRPRGQLAKPKMSIEEAFAGINTTTTSCDLAIDDIISNDMTSEQMFIEKAFADINTPTTSCDFDIDAIISNDMTSA